MSETPEPNQPNPTETPAPKPDEELGDKGLKALQAERSARQAAEKERDEAKAKALKWDEAEQANKSELERAREEAAQAAADAQEARTEALRLRIATRHGISDEDADVFLTASDEAGLEAQATRLAEIAKSKADADRHTPDPSQGPRKTVQKSAWDEGRERAKAMFGKD